MGRTKRIVFLMVLAATSNLAVPLHAKDATEAAPDLERLKSVPLETVLPCDAKSPDKGYYTYLEGGRGVVVILCRDGKLSALFGDRKLPDAANAHRAPEDGEQP